MATARECWPFLWPLGWLQKAPLSPTSGAGGEPTLERVLATSGTSGWGRTARVSKSPSQNELPLVLLGRPMVKCPQIQLEAMVDFCGLPIL